jgi:NAD+ kinase
MTTNHQPYSFNGRPRVMVLGLGSRQHVVDEAERARPLIEAVADIVTWDFTFTADLSRVEADIAFVFGGDGSILRAAHQMGYRQVPVVGVNLGKLGFLADLRVDEMLAVLPSIATGEFRVIEHLMVECEVIRDNQQVWQRLVLNEVAVRAGEPFRMLQLHLYVDAEWVTTYSCDGLIVATPVGSTAHSLSAGGPILRKDLQALVISPISPHTLTNRPVVDSAERVFDVQVVPPQTGAFAVVDGQVVSELQPGDRVRIRRAEPKFKLVEVKGHGYYRTLREKLGWGGSLTAGEGR